MRGAGAAGDRRSPFSSATGFPTSRPDQEVRRLTLAERQVVEIAKALARDPAVLILDEATSALAPRETEWLLDARREPRRASGKLVIYISHRLQEVRHVAKRITVFRNGMTVAAPRHDCGRAMTRSSPRCSAGGSTGSTRSGKRTATERVALRVRGLSAGHRLRDVDLDLREGEVLGVGGLQGHGQRELFQALFGIGRAQGSVELWGKPLPARGPRQRLVRPRRHRAGAGGSPRPGAAPLEERRREPHSCRSSRASRGSGFLNSAQRAGAGRRR